MQTVTFHCPHCNNLMAVGLELLGHQVQCPTCQRILVAPAVAEPRPAEPEPQVSFDQPERESHESIFGEQLDEDLFGSKPPKVEIPQPDTISLRSPAPAGESRFAEYPPGVPQPAPEAVAETVAPVEAPPIFEVVSPPPPAVIPPMETPAVTTPPSEPPTVFWSPAASAVAPELPPPASDGIPAPPTLAEQWLPTSEPAPEQPWSAAAHREEGNGQGAMRLRAVEREHRKGANLLLIILGPYSVLMTLVAGWYFYKSTHMSAADHAFANIPDIFAQYDPATRKQLSRRVDGLPAVDAPLPDSLIVKLGQTLRVGDLEVTPEKIEQGKVRMHTLTQDNQTSMNQLPGESLILFLKVKNRSKDIFFHPTDPVFDRKYDKSTGSSKPYTQVVVGKDHFYGGALDVLGVNWQKIKRRYVTGQDNDDRPLPPGEERHTVICTDPQDVACLDAVKSYKGGEPILWRVQLRRGLTDFRGQSLSVCAVIGVQFNPGDVQKAR